METPQTLILLHENDDSLLNQEDGSFLRLCDRTSDERVEGNGVNDPGDARHQAAGASSLVITTALNSYSVEVPIPEELYEIRERLGFDYGKLDYVLRDGKVVLFDVNRPPATATLQMWGLMDQVAKRLAGGITSKLAAFAISAGR